MRAKKIVYSPGATPTLDPALLKWRNHFRGKVMNTGPSKFIFSIVLAREKLLLWQELKI